MTQRVPYTERTMSIDELAEHHDYVMPRANDQDIKYLMIEHLSPLGENTTFSRYELQMLLGGLYVDMINEKHDLDIRTQRAVIQKASKIDSNVYPIGFLFDIHTGEQSIDDAIKNVKVDITEQKPRDIDRLIREGRYSELDEQSGYRYLLTGLEEKLFRINYEFVNQLSLVLADKGLYNKAVSVGEQSEQMLLEIVTRNMGLVKKEAGVNSGLPYEDRLQEGKLAIVRAWKNFDYTRGLKFSTSATNWVHQMIGREINKTSRTVTIPDHLCVMMKRFRRLLDQAEMIKGRYLNETERIELISKTEGVDKIKAEDLLGVFQQKSSSLSFDSTLNNDPDESTLSDIVPDTSAYIEVELALLAKHKLFGEEGLFSLSVQERRVLELKYKLNDNKRNTTNNGRTSVREIAKKVGVSTHNLYKIERRALERLRVGPGQELSEYLDDLMN